MDSKNKDISKLILLINHAAQTYKNVSKHHADDHIEHFFDELSQNHKSFLKEAGDDYNVANELPIKNQLEPDSIFNRESAIDQLILCKDLEKAILAQAREAVHNSSYNGEQKKLLCKQLTYSEKALFKADQMLEIYE